jgi:hypothetical protein
VANASGLGKTFIGLKYKAVKLSSWTTGAMEVQRFYPVGFRIWEMFHSDIGFDIFLVANAQFSPGSTPAPDK